MGIINPKTLLWCTLFLQLHCSVWSKYKCPKQCVCDIDDGLKKATCVNHNIIDVNLAVPPNLDVYDLSYNTIPKLEDYAFVQLNLKSLTQLNLAHNQIFWIGLHAFAGLEKLTHLNLSYNRIQALPTDLFWYNEKLQSLDLSGNKFLRISNQPFLSHSSLKILNLAKSQISHLPETSFRNLSSLLEINLSDNLMIELNIDLFEPLVHLERIDISNNEWHCNDKFRDLQHWLQKREVKFEPQCKTVMKNGPKMFEKMVMNDGDNVTDKSEEDRELDELWDDDVDTPAGTNFTESLNETRSLVYLFNKHVSSTYGLIIGFEVGLVLGIFGTYCWIARPVKCSGLNIKSRRQNLRRQKRVDQSDARDQLLHYMFSPENSMTPPVMRRQMSSPLATYRSNSWEIQDISDLQSDGPFVTDNSRVTNVTRDVSVCPETPPPGYNDCHRDVVLTFQ